MIVDVGEKVHVIERRYFEQDMRRHFIGQVVRCSENAIRVKGYVWVYDVLKGGFSCKQEERERVIQLGGDRLTINIIPPEVNLNEIKYTHINNGLVATDGKKFHLDVAEFSSRH